MPTAIANIVHFTKQTIIACAIAPLLLAAWVWLALDNIFREAELKVVYGGDVAARDRHRSKYAR